MQRQKTMRLNNMRERKNSNVKKFVLATTGMVAMMPVHMRNNL
jgi:hypothetical protein